ncbi:metallopeptidase family protein [Thermophilibacter mediterraneus]|uniref:metallopeptidase family protein n=1 Tax=Thermophilibacter mediterraneus TaxID=1871031 RepID=UPI00093183DC|nr:metallopeptidase family protein [Thermophilibacter mediterraneus]
MTDEQFERAVEDALDTIPERFWEQLDNVIFAVEDEPTEEELSGSGDDNASFSDDELLGLYDGTPLTERDSFYGTGELPDVITIFKGPHERCFEELGEAALRDEIRRTVIHEVGHYFGNDEETLAEMGY